MIVISLFAAIYKRMPAVRLKWSDAIIGAAFGALLFTTGKQLMAIYLGKVTIGSPDGARNRFCSSWSGLLFGPVVLHGIGIHKNFVRRHGSHYANNQALR